MKSSPKAIISLALQEVGMTEKKTNAGYDSKTENAGNNNWNKYANYIDTMFPTFYNGKKNGYDWCDIFVDWLFLFSYGLEKAMLMLYQPMRSGGAGCTTSRSYYKKAGKYGKEAKLGAQIFFTKDGGVSCYHTGIVVDIRGKSVITVEGNSGDKVSQRAYDMNDPKIDGYGYPLYDEENDVKEEGTMKSELEIAKEVIKGLWGTGAGRIKRLTEAGYNYSNVQGIVNALVSGGSVEQAEESKVFTVDVPKNKYDKIVINLV